MYYNVSLSSKDVDWLTQKRKYTSWQRSVFLQISGMFKAWLRGSAWVSVFSTGDIWYWVLGVWGVGCVERFINVFTAVISFSADKLYIGRTYMKNRHIYKQHKTASSFTLKGQSTQNDISLIYHRLLCGFKHQWDFLIHVFWSFLDEIPTCYQQEVSSPIFLDSSSKL